MEIFLVTFWIGSVSAVIGLLLLIAGYIIREAYTKRQPLHKRKAICSTMIRWGWRVFGSGGLIAIVASVMLMFVF